MAFSESIHSCEICGRLYDDEKTPESVADKDPTGLGDADHPLPTGSIIKASLCYPCAYQERLQRMISRGSIDPECDFCQREFLSHLRLDPFAPRHTAMDTCRSGKRPHCTCDTCF